MHFEVELIFSPFVSLQIQQRTFSHNKASIKYKNRYIVSIDPDINKFTLYQENDSLCNKAGTGTDGGNMNHLLEIQGNAVSYHLCSSRWWYECPLDKITKYSLMSEHVVALEIDLRATGSNPQSGRHDYEDLSIEADHIHLKEYSNINTSNPYTTFQDFNHHSSTSKCCCGCRLQLCCCPPTPATCAAWKPNKCSGLGNRRKSNKAPLILYCTSATLLIEALHNVHSESTQHYFKKLIESRILPASSSCISKTAAEEDGSSFMKCTTGIIGERIPPIIQNLQSKDKTDTSTIYYNNISTPLLKNSNETLANASSSNTENESGYYSNCGGAGTGNGGASDTNLQRKESNQETYNQIISDSRLMQEKEDRRIGFSNPTTTSTMKLNEFEIEIAKIFDLLRDIPSMLPSPPPFINLKGEKEFCQANPKEGKDKSSLVVEEVPQLTSSMIEFSNRNGKDEVWREKTKQWLLKTYETSKSPPQTRLDCDLRCEPKLIREGYNNNHNNDLETNPNKSFDSSTIIQRQQQAYPSNSKLPSTAFDDDSKIVIRNKNNYATTNKSIRPELHSVPKAIPLQTTCRINNNKNNNNITQIINVKGLVLKNQKTSVKRRVERITLSGSVGSSSFSSPDPEPPECGGNREKPPVEEDLYVVMKTPPINNNNNNNSTNNKMDRLPPTNRFETLIIPPLGNNNRTNTTKGNQRHQETTQNINFAIAKGSRFDDEEIIKSQFDSELASADTTNWKTGMKPETIPSILPFQPLDLNQLVSLKNYNSNRSPLKSDELKQQNEEDWLTTLERKHEALTRKFNNHHNMPTSLNKSTSSSSPTKKTLKRFLSSLTSTPTPTPVIKKNQTASTCCRDGDTLMLGEKVVKTDEIKVRGLHQQQSQSLKIEDESSNSTNTSIIFVPSSSPEMRDRVYNMVGVNHPKYQVMISRSPRNSTKRASVSLPINDTDDYTRYEKVETTDLKIHSNFRKAVEDDKTTGSICPNYYEGIDKKDKPVTLQNHNNCNSKLLTTILEYSSMLFSSNTNNSRITGTKGRYEKNRVLDNEISYNNKGTATKVRSFYDSLPRKKNYIVVRNSVLNR